ERMTFQTVPQASGTTFESSCPAARRRTTASGRPPSCSSRTTYFMRIPSAGELLFMQPDRQPLCATSRTLFHRARTGLRKASCIAAEGSYGVAAGLVAAVGPAGGAAGGAGCAGGSDTVLGATGVPAWG